LVLALCEGLCGFFVGGAEVAEAGYGGGDESEGFVDFGFSGETREREADACTGTSGAEAHGGEDV
jgi:hypothetical protein